MELLINKLHVKISNEEFYGIDKPCNCKFSKVLIKLLKRYNKGQILTYYISYKENEQILDEYNQYLYANQMPVFNTLNAKN